MLQPDGIRQLPHEAGGCQSCRSREGRRTASRGFGGARRTCGRGARRRGGAADSRTRSRAQNASSHPSPPRSGAGIAFPCRSITTCTSGEYGTAGPCFLAEIPYRRRGRPPRSTHRVWPSKPTRLQTRSASSPSNLARSRCAASAVRHVIAPAPPRRTFESTRPGSDPPPWDRRAGTGPTSRRSSPRRTPRRDRVPCARARRSSRRPRQRRAPSRRRSSDSAFLTASSAPSLLRSSSLGLLEDEILSLTCRISFSILSWPGTSVCRDEYLHSCQSGVFFLRNSLHLTHQRIMAPPPRSFRRHACPLKILSGRAGDRSRKGVPARRCTALHEYAPATSFLHLCPVCMAHVAVHVQEVVFQQNQVGPVVPA